MKALHLKTKKTLEFWLIGNESQPDWVRKAFENGGFRQNGRKLIIVNTYGLVKISVSADEILVFNGKYAKVLPKTKFEREYKII